MTGRVWTVIRTWSARLPVLLLLASMASWAMISVARASSAAVPRAAADYAWPLPDWMPPPPVPLDNPMSTAKVELGRRLFYDVRLAGLTGQRHPRNSQALANVAYLPSLTWADPSITSLEQQAKLPLFGKHPVEMLASGRESAIVARFEVDQRYVELFAAAFPETGGRIDFDAIRKALASFERTLLSFGSPYDRWRYGGEADAIDDAAKRGARLFFSQRLGCGRCHPTPLFTDAVGADGYHNTGLYNLDGHGALPAGNQGLIEHTGVPSDMGKFRTPSLRNVAVTGPYMHDGSVKTLSEAIDDYAAGGRSARMGKRSQLTSSLVAGFALTDGEKTNLLAFLSALSDPHLLEPWHQQGRRRQPELVLLSPENSGKFRLVRGSSPQVGRSEGYLQPYLEQHEV